MDKLLVKESCISTFQNIANPLGYVHTTSAFSVTESFISTFPNTANPLEYVYTTSTSSVREKGIATEKDVPSALYVEEPAAARSAISNRQVSAAEIREAKVVKLRKSARYVLLSDEDPLLALEIQPKLISLTSLDEEITSVPLSDDYISGEALSYKMGLDDWAVVAATSPHSSQLQWYQVSDEELEFTSSIYLPGVVTALRHFGPLLAAVVDRSIYVYRTDVSTSSDVWLMYSVRLPSPVTDIAVTAEAMDWIMGVALPDSVEFYRITVDSDTLSITNEVSVEMNGVTGLTAFKNGFNTYFAVSGPDAEIWRILEDLEVETVSADLGHVAIWKAVPLATFRHEHALFADNGTNVLVYLEDQHGGFSSKGLLSQITNHRTRDSALLTDDLTLLRSCSSGQSLLVPYSNEKGGVLIRINSVVVDIPDPVKEEIAQLMKLKQKIMDQWDQQEGEAEELLSELSMINDNENQERKQESLTVETLTVEDVLFSPLSEEDAMHVESTEFSHMPWTVEDSEEDLSVLLKDLHQLASDIQELGEQLENAVLPVQNPTSVTQNDQFPSVIKTGLRVEGHVFVEKAVVTELNGHVLQDWMEDTFRFDRPQKIGGTKVVQKATTRSLQFDTLGGIPSEELVYADDLENVVINGDVIFEKDVMIVDSVKMAPGGTVNGMDLHRDIVRVDVIPEGDVSFERVIVNNMDVEDTINGVPAILPTHSLDDIDVNTIQQVRLDKVTVTDYLIASTINGLNVTDVIEALRNANEGSEIATVSSLNVENINGFKFPEDLVRLSEVGTVESVKHFAKLSAQDLETDWSTFLDLVGDYEQAPPPSKAMKMRNHNTDDDGMFYADGFSNNELDDSVEEDLLSLDAYNVEVYGSIITISSVNEYNLAHIQKKYLSKSLPQTVPPEFFGPTLNITGNLTTTLVNKKFPNVFHEVIVKGSLSTAIEDETNLLFEDLVSINQLDIANGSINGVNITELHNDSVYKDENDVDIRGAKTIVGGIAVKNMHVQNINGTPLSDIITVNGSYALKNSLVVNGNVIVSDGLLAYDHVNGVNMTVLGERVSTTHGAILVNGDLEMASDAEVGHLVVGNSIDGKNLRQILNDAARVDELFKMPKNVTFSEQVTINGNLKITKSINKINASFFDNIVLLDRPARLDRLTLQKTAMFRHLIVEDNMKAALLDSCDTASWEEEAVRLDEKGLIHGVIRLTDAEVHGLVVADAVNGEFLTNYVHLTVDQLFPGTVSLENISVSSNIQVDMHVNDVVLAEERDDTLMQHGNQEVTGAKIFGKSVVIDGDLKASHISERPLEELVTTYTQQAIAANVSVVGGVTVFGDLHVGGYLGGVDLENWHKRALLPLPNQTIEGSWTVKGNIEVLSDVNGSGVLKGSNLRNVSQSYGIKEQEAHSQYQSVCFNVSSVYNRTKHELQLLDMLDDVQGLEFSHNILSIISFNVAGRDFMVVTFFDHCQASIYKWDSLLGKFVLLTRAELGPVHVWTTLRWHSSVAIVTHNSGKDVCHDGRSSGNVWQFNGSTLQHVTSMKNFQSVISDNSSAYHFFTVNTAGTVSRWELYGGPPLRAKQYNQLSEGTYSFVPWELGVGLAVWDGDTILHLPEEPSPVENIHLPGASVAVTKDGTLAALSDGHSTILVVRGAPDGQIIDRLHFSKPTNVMWLDMGAPGQLYLIFASDHQKVHMYRYMGVSGMIEYLTLHHPSSSLVGIEPITNQPHAILVHGKSFRVLKPVMHGQPDLQLDFEC